MKLEEKLRLAFSLHQNNAMLEARELYLAILEENPGNPDVLHLLGVLHAQTGDCVSALSAIKSAIQINENIAEYHCNLGGVLFTLLRLDESRSSLETAIRIRPNYYDALANLGNVLICLGDLEGAKECYEKAYLVNNNGSYILGLLVNSKMKICCWSKYKENVSSIKLCIDKRLRVSSTFPLVSCIEESLIHLKCAEIWVADKYPMRGNRIEKQIDVGVKIRIGYFSSDFHNHATTWLMAELFELHDRSRFELFAFSFGVASNDEMRKRVVEGVDHFFDVSEKSDEEIAQLSRSWGIDIAVDLKGFTEGSRNGIFAYRAAPIQVNYLGYPGTLGADYIDYIVADPTLIPAESQKYYSEKVVYLPHSYQVNDRKRAIADKIFTRSEVGLPDEGFVFCCFNNNYKITPLMFDVWVRILKAVPGSVLWLYEDNPIAASNLRKEAVARGLEESRLIFAEKMPLAEHLARHRLADLFLDTFPCNAHTTASDALWAGLPLMTKMGESFAARVAGSLLNAMYLPELIVQTDEEYESLAISLAKGPEKLMEIRKKLDANRMTAPLFDSQLYTKNLESAYKKMIENYNQGKIENIYIR